MEALIYFVVMILLDSFLWGFCFEIKMLQLPNLKKGIYSFFFFEWLYGVFERQIQWLMDETSRYRIFQKIVEVLGLVVVGITTEWNWFILGGILIAYYLSSFEMGYYILMNQVQLPRESNIHLRKWWNVGGLIELSGQPFNVVLFYIFAVFGLAIMLLTGFGVVSL